MSAHSFIPALMHQCIAMHSSINSCIHPSIHAFILALFFTSMISFALVSFHCHLTLPSHRPLAHSLMHLVASIFHGFLHFKDEHSRHWFLALIVSFRNFCPGGRPLACTPQISLACATAFSLGCAPIIIITITIIILILILILIILIILITMILIIMISPTAPPPPPSASASPRRSQMFTVDSSLGTRRNQIEPTSTCRLVLNASSCNNCRPQWHDNTVQIWKRSACVSATTGKMMRLLCLRARRNMDAIAPPHPTRQRTMMKVQCLCPAGKMMRARKWVKFWVRKWVRGRPGTAGHYCWLTCLGLWHTYV